MTRLVVFALIIPSVAYSAPKPHANELMWRQELVSAVLKSFGKKPPNTEPASQAPLLGSWVDQDDPRQVIHFEAARCIFARIGEPGSPRFTRTAYAPGKIKTYSWAQKKGIRARAEGPSSFADRVAGWKNQDLSKAREDTGRGRGQAFEIR